MNIRNMFILSLAENISKLPFDQRQRITKKVLEDLDKTDILTPIDVLGYDDDIDWFKQQEDDIEDVYEAMKEVEREERIKQKEIEYSDYAGLPECPLSSCKITRYGRTELHEAVLANDVETVKRLLKEGLNIDVKDNNGNDALMLARLEQRDEIVKVFEESSVS